MSVWLPETYDLVHCARNWMTTNKTIICQSCDKVVRVFFFNPDWESLCVMMTFSFNFIFSQQQIEQNLQKKVSTSKTNWPIFIILHYPVQFLHFENFFPNIISIKCITWLDSYDFIGIKHWNNAKLSHFWPLLLYCRLLHLLFYSQTEQKDWMSLRTHRKFSLNFYVMWLRCWDKADCQTVL